MLQLGLAFLTYCLADNKQKVAGTQHRGIFYIQECLGRSRVATHRSKVEAVKLKRIQAQYTSDPVQIHEAENRCDGAWTVRY